ncbi:response regulator transcription factor [Pseudonocardia spinosispora]|uniref:response regulator transcription factor n=1 Tax=Pseudonocardia spinosispora TaxID=103441 RepID=UPI00048C7EA2|nr:response regulator transcription factor [Pseudonocardia spinosispora]
MRVLLVEGGPTRSGALASIIQRRGHHPTRSRLDGPIAADGTDVVVLDLDQPDPAGFGALRRIRAVSRVPVLVLESPAQLDSVVRWLELGADDYLVKPAMTDELVARIEALARRAATPAGPPEQVVRVADVRVDLRRRTVIVGDETIRLTGKQFDVLATLARRAGSPVSRHTIMVEAWDDGPQPNSRSLDVHLAALRAKLRRPELLRTIHGFGYLFG